MKMIMYVYNVSYLQYIIKQWYFNHIIGSCYSESDESETSHYKGPIICWELSHYLIIMNLTFSVLSLWVY